MAGSVDYATWGTDASAKLRALLERLKRDDPFAPVTVAAPSLFAALALRRVAANFSLGASGRTGIVNVGFTTVPRLADRMGAEIVAAEGRRPLSDHVASEAVRAALEATIPAKSALGRLMSNPATERAFEQTIGDLRSADADLLRQISATRGQLAETVIRVYETYSSLVARFYDVGHVASAGADLLRTDPDCHREIGHVVLYAPRAAGRVEWPLIEALANADRLSAVIAITGEEDVDRDLLELGKRLSVVLGCDQPDQPPELAPSPRPTRIITAPDPEEEVRIVIRELLAAAEQGDDLYRTALLYAADQPYARLVADLLNQVQIPYSGLPSRQLRDTAAGRVLLGALRVAESDLQRSSVIAWLSSEQVVDPQTARPAPCRQWDRCSREAGVIGGASNWAEQLARYIEISAIEAADQDASDSKRQAHARNAEAAKALNEFVLELSGACEIFDRDSSRAWSDFAEGATRLLDVYTGGATARQDWPASEAEAFERVLASVASLNSLDEFRELISVETFARALDRLLDAPAPNERRFGDGVFVGRLGDAAGSDFDKVYLIGMTESACPPSPVDDPLLPDEVREAALTGVGYEQEWPALLPLGSDRIVRARRDYLASIASGSSERILVHPLGETRAGRIAMPSLWAVEAASELSKAHGGGSLRVQDLMDPSRNDEWNSWRTLVPSFAAALADTSLPPASMQEHALRELEPTADSGELSLESELIRGSVKLWRGVATKVSLVDDRASAWSGLVGPVSMPERAVSPTSLERWALCPYQYFLGKVLRLGALEAPEEIEEIAPTERGRLVHAILDDFHTQHLGHRGAWSSNDRAALRATAEQHFVDYEEAGLTGRPILWQIEKGRILRSLDKVLEADEAFRAGLGVSTSQSEVGFGLPDQGKTFSVHVPGVSDVAFLGRIDRLDSSSDGKLSVVVDYKTGNASRAERALCKVNANSDGAEAEFAEIGAATESGLEADPVDGGRSLQLPAYGLAARELAGSDRAIAFYWHIDRTFGTSTCYGYPCDEGVDDRFGDVVGSIVTGIDGGVFPMNPGEPSYFSERGVNCGWCEFDVICPADRQRIYELKHRAPEYSVYAELEPVDEDGEGAG